MFSSKEALHKNLGFCFLSGYPSSSQEWPVRNIQERSFLGIKGADSNLQRFLRRSKLNEMPYIKAKK